MVNTKKSVYKNHNEARVLGTSPYSGYELSRIIVPRDKFMAWIDEQAAKKTEIF